MFPGSDRFSERQASTSTQGEIERLLKLQVCLDRMLLVAVPVLLVPGIIAMNSFGRQDHLGGEALGASILRWQGTESICYLKPRRKLKQEVDYVE